MYIQNPRIDFDIIQNIEQIQHLEEYAQYWLNHKYYGRWREIWSHIFIDKVKGYYDDGLKVGLWQQPIKNYWNQAQIYEKGEYSCNKKCGRWIYIQDKYIIGGGSFDESNHCVKIGKWIELDECFYKNKQVTHKGEYKNGKKIGIWDIELNDQGNKIIGGGSYKNSIKCGWWTEPSEWFTNNFQMLWEGEYKHGQKIGQWKILLNGNKIGGGSFDKRGQGIKIGSWKEPSEHFFFNLQVMERGDYKGGMKVGKWDILQSYETRQIIGGGSYNDGIKIGLWTELADETNQLQTETYIGQYKNGKKSGSWDMFRFNQEKYHWCGTLVYDEIGNLLSKTIIKKSILYEGRIKSNKKIGRWDIFLLNNVRIPEIFIGCGYYDLGCKVGKWIEPIEGFNENFQVVYDGCYKNGIKVGKWELKLGQTKIGVGSYDQRGEGIKIGMWIEPIKWCTRDFQIEFRGEYKNGIRIGRWDIFLNEQVTRVIGGGSYDELGNGIKIGKWIDLDEEFNIEKQLTYWGKYNNGKKDGQWDLFEYQQETFQFHGSLDYDQMGNLISKAIMNTNFGYKGNLKNSKKVGNWNIYCEFSDYSDPSNIIGGGSYDLAGDEIKIGKWIEPSKWFTKDFQIEYRGEYKNGIKIGRWDIFLNEQVIRIIGGGSYDEQGNGIKIGKWIDLDEEFNIQKQITYWGEYNIGKKYGKWDKFAYQQDQYFWKGYLIYDVLGNLLSKRNNEAIIVYIGKLYNGKKVGKWDIEVKSERNDLFIKIGGGLYDEQGNVKIGKWIDWDTGFDICKQLTYSGNYNNGKKIGQWSIRYNNGSGYREIGGGFYDLQCDEIKIGKWIDLDAGFDCCKQVTYSGVYQNGKKVGLWEIWFKESYEENKKIGGGSYDELGNGIKIGKWIDLDEEFNIEKQVTYEGVYKNGKRVGEWDTNYQRDYGSEQIKIGGGSYDEQGNGIKIGYWIDLDALFNTSKQITYWGEYKNGKKSGKWDIFEYQQEIFYFHGSIYYDEMGSLISKVYWELDRGFKGKLKNRKKIGRWETLDIKTLEIMDINDYND